MMNRLPLSVRYPFLLIFCVGGGLGSISSFLSTECDPHYCGVAQEIGTLSVGMTAALFLASAWMLWKRSARTKYYGTIAFGFAMLISTAQAAIGFAAIRATIRPQDTEIYATIGFAVGLVMVFGYFMWLWVGVVRERTEE